MRRRPLHVLVLGIAAALLATACTVSTNDEPVALDSESFENLVTTTTATPTSDPGPVTKLVDVYFLRTTDGATQLVPAPRELDAGATVQEVLSDLITRGPDTEGEDREAEEGLSTAIPSNAVLLSADLQPGSSELVVDMQGLFGEIQASELRRALAQIVYTATENDDVSTVSFRNDGEPANALTGAGDTTDQPVSRRDYQTLS